MRPSYLTARQIRVCCELRDKVASAEHQCLNVQSLRSGVSAKAETGYEGEVVVEAGAGKPRVQGCSGVLPFSDRTPTVLALLLVLFSVQRAGFIFGANDVCFWSACSICFNHLDLRIKAGMKWVQPSVTDRMQIEHM
jgi:hypothetical protein